MLPTIGDSVHGGIQVFECVVVERVVHPFALPSAFYQACLAEDLEVERQKRLFGAHNLRQFADATLPTRESCHNLEAFSVGERVKRLLERVEVELNSAVHVNIISIHFDMSTVRSMMTISYPASRKE